MAKPEWGTKRECSSCGVWYYDLQRSRISCPKCDAVYELQPAKGKARPTPGVQESPADTTETSSHSAKSEESAEAPKDGLNDEVIEVEAIEADENGAADDDGLIEDTSDLGEDEDDVAAAIEEKPKNETE